MAKDEREFFHESLQDSQSIADYLKALTDGFAQGTFNVTDKRGEIVLRPGGLVRFQIEASRKRDRVKMTIRLDWSEEQPATLDGDRLSITTEDE
ncbi:MAG: amphi-Trp domain-containing protein [Candidatus Eisenbacteria bacterium]|uniref:Amphi-Trp domain-containing protein n=1 Tax=Eiseniibacteriota bacterium TaxID=2212470 RepID=A0A956RPE0_UNCEI|nr:amphi-Trp domain-containing protein [Candidatus Eisenbacteria bacterium]